MGSSTSNMSRILVICVCVILTISIILLSMENWSSPLSRAQTFLLTSATAPAASKRIMRLKAKKSTINVPPESLPKVDPFSPSFLKYMAFRKGRPVVKCNGNLIRVEPWVKVVDGDKIVFSVPSNVEGDVVCLVHEMKVWPSDARIGDYCEANFWPPKTLMRLAKNYDPTNHVDVNGDEGQGHVDGAYDTHVRLDKSDFAAVDCSSSSLNSTGRHHTWSGLVSGIHKMERAQQHPTAVFNSSETSAKRKKLPNVLMIIVDAVSRYAAENAMPLTMDYLRHGLGAAIFEHHTVVGENSLPNAIGFLTGRRLEDIPTPKSGPMVEYPLIWKEFSRRGYRTAYIEDWPITFRDNVKSYMMTEQPTDHIGYMFGKYIYNKIENNCIFGQPLHELFLNLPEAMWVTYPDPQPKFYISWFNQYSHTEMSEAAYIDVPLTRMLQTLKTKGLLNNTITIVMGDHGNRYMHPKFRLEKEGRLDHRTPLLAIVPPFGEEDQNGRLSWNILRSNTKKLTSHFDLHATLWDVIRHVPGQPSLPEHKNRSFAGQSLFTPIPKLRSCKEAGITTFFCPYLDWSLNDLSSSRLSVLGKKYVDFINNYVEKYFKHYGVHDVPCKKISTYAAHNGGVLEPGTFYLILWVTFGRRTAQFELSGTYDDDLKNVTYSIHSLARVNRFGDSPYCLSKFPQSLEKKIVEYFCFCIKDSAGPRRLLRANMP